MVLADLGRKITTALHSLSRATVINEEVCLAFKISFFKIKHEESLYPNEIFVCAGIELYAKGDMRSIIGGRCKYPFGKTIT